MNQTELGVNVTVIVENLEDIKEVIKDTENSIILLKGNIRKLEQIGLQFQVKTNKG